MTQSRACPRTAADQATTALSSELQDPARPERAEATEWLRDQGYVDQFTPQLATWSTRDVQRGY